jgi:hypothetical protein
MIKSLPNVAKEFPLFRRNDPVLRYEDEKSTEALTKGFRRVEIKAQRSLTMFQEIVNGGHW